MRIVLDNNILVSGLINPRGAPAQLRDAWQDGQFELITSREQTTRLEIVLRRPKFAKLFSVQDVTTLLEDIEAAAEFVIPQSDVNTSPDPEDNVILGTALAGQVNFVVTGDKNDLLALSQVEAVRIITAREALQVLEP